MQGADPAADEESMGEDDLSRRLEGRKGWTVIQEICVGLFTGIMSVSLKLAF